MYIERHAGSGLDGLFISLINEYRDPDHEVEIAPGITGGYDKAGELLFLEITGEASLKVSSVDLLEAHGFEAVKILQRAEERSQ